MTEEEQREVEQRAQYLCAEDGIYPWMICFNKYGTSPQESGAKYAWHAYISSAVAQLGFVNDE